MKAWMLWCGKGVFCFSVQVESRGSMKNLKEFRLKHESFLGRRMQLFPVVSLIVKIHKASSQPARPLVYGILTLV